MKWFRVLHSEIRPYEVEAIDEKDAIFQWESHHQVNIGDLKDPHVTVEQFIKPIKPAFVRVHHGYITVNLIPEIAEKLNYKEGDRLPTFNDFMNVVDKQNEFIVDDWFNRTGNEKPINKLEAFNFMVEHFQNNN
ncbi:MAG: hypothetical protein [Microviridae sp.]|nr:MAG: hypothetical protein [Microviridae sp.]